MKLLISHPYFNEAGGAEHRIRTLIEHFRTAKEIEKTFMICGDMVFSDSKMEVMRFKTPYLVKKLTEMLIKEKKINIVQAHNYQNIGLGALEMAQEKNIANIFNLHDLHVVCPRLFMTDGGKEMPPCEKPVKCFNCVSGWDLWMCKREREIIEKCTAGVVPSNFYKDKMSKLGVLKGKWRVIKPWVSPIFTNNPYKSIDKAANRVLLCGNLLPFKGAPLFLRAMPKILNELKFPLEFRTFSQMGLPEVAHMAKKMGLTRFLSNTGIKNKPLLVEEYLNATLTVVPSQWDEVVNLTIIESITQGTPVIASAVGSIPELFGEDIILVKDWANRDAWADTVIDFFKNKTKYEGKALKSREKFRKLFNVQRATRDYIDMYKELLK